MRPLFLFPASLLMLATSTLARDLPYPQAGVTTSTVQVTAPARSAWIAPDRARELAGYYTMSNGWDLKVRPGARYITATIDREMPMRLFAVSADKFVSADGSVSMQFNEGESGNDMTMRYVPDRHLAQVVVLSARMAGR